jgi:hypothetical protein
VHPAYVQLPEDQPTSPHDLALIVLDSPVPPEFPTIALAQGEEGLGGTVPAAREGHSSPVARSLLGWTPAFPTACDLPDPFLAWPPALRGGALSSSWSGAAGGGVGQH